MGLRDNASCIRPRLYDRHDPERPDDVGLLLEALDLLLDGALDDRNEERVAHAHDLKQRIARSAGESYEDHEPGRAAGEA